MPDPVTARNGELRVVLFDVGGVLVELSGVQTMLTWLGNRLTDRQLWARWLASPCIRAYETGRIDTDAFADRLIAEMELPVARDEFLRVFEYWPRCLFPGALDLLARVPPQYLKATLSNTNVLHWARVTGEMGLDRAFDRHFASHLIGFAKPDEAAYTFVARELGVAPAQILFLDDNEPNVEAALRAGMQASVAKGLAAAERALVEHGILCDCLLGA